MHIRCLPMWMRYYIKFRRSFTHPFNTISGITEKTIIFADAPDYGNLGDQAIALAVHKFAEIYFPDHKILEIPMEQFAKYAHILKKTLPDKCPVFLTGGGNMGDRYPIYEAARRYVISQFSNHKIVVFPQTYDYASDLAGCLFSLGAKQVYSAHPRLLLCAREKESYRKMSNMYTHNTCILCPDTALMLDFKSTQVHRRNTIGICLRDDSEQALSTADRSIVEEYISKSGEKICRIETCQQSGLYNVENREQAVNSLLEKVASCRLLVTDRLHAMIFAYITHTPCVAFDNSNKKVRGVYEWLKNDQQIQLAQSADDFARAVRLALAAGCTRTDFSEHFARISDWIKGENHGTD
ncbi:MAG: polysaccharide pyruvyl transferase family protein [Oscillospiraceae bacterium]|nr:polysaccharide pyruvyl transferase family protein [Oscillospiraceae bacterium]